MGAGESDKVGTKYVTTRSSPRRLFKFEKCVQTLILLDYT